MTINKFLIGFFTLILASGTILCSSRAEPGLYAFRLSWDIPILDQQADKIYHIQGNNNIYQYKDIIIYRQEGQLIDTGNKESVIYFYYLLKEGKKRAIKYDPRFQGSKLITVSADTFLRKHAFKGFPFFDKVNDSLVKKKSFDSFLSETYVPRKKNDLSYPDSQTFYYDKEMLMLKFTLSEELDKSKRSRLVKIHAIYNPVINGKFKSEAEKRELNIQIDKISVQNKEVIMSIISKFQNQLNEIE